MQGREDASGTGRHHSLGVVEKVTEHNIEGCVDVRRVGRSRHRVQLRGPSFVPLGRMGVQLGGHWESLGVRSRDSDLSRNLK